MPDGIELKTNLPDFKEKMKAFGYDIERNIIRAGVSAAARVFFKAAQSVLLRPRRSKIRGGTKNPESPGQLRRALYIKRARDSKLGLEHYFVGVRKGKEQQTRKGGAADAFYARFVELGHRIVPRGQAISGGKRTKALRRARFDASGGSRTQPYPFMQPAFQRGNVAALAAFTERVQKRIDKENAKR